MKVKGRPKGSYKYSERQMRNYLSMSRNIKQKNYWINKIFKQRNQRFLRVGNKIQARSAEQSRKRALSYAKHGGTFARQHWKVASQSDIFGLISEGKLSKDGTKLLILDESNNAVVIAYAGSELFDEVMEIKKNIVAS